MPEPVVTKPATEKAPLTHVVTLENGKSFSLVDKNRPGVPWQFTESVPVKVPAYVAERLRAKATDDVTARIGQKVSSQTMQKFQIEEIKK